MLKIVGTMTIFGGLAFLGLGFIFIVAGGSDNALIGALCIGLGMIMFLLTYLIVRAEAKRPVKQDINIQMGGSGKFLEKSIHCPGCGGSMKEENIKLIEGGLMITCPFCGKLSALEEEPKW
jgi:energy-converting hydrogenase Eha subunit C